MEFLDLRQEEDYQYDSNLQSYHVGLCNPFEQLSSTKEQIDFSLSSEVISNQGSSDDTKQKKNNLIKKNIKKHEPIVDNAVVYRYEDNPEEYKKMRKKQQNRESATRVRYKQKNYVEQMEFDMNELKQQNSQLQLTNAKIQAENNVLKQQLQFFQNLMQQNIQIVDDTHKIIPTFEMERVIPQKNHFVFLTIMTAMVCVLFMNQEDNGTSYEQVAMAFQTNNTITPLDNHQFSNQISRMIENNSKYQTLITTGLYSILFVYILYLIYVLCSFNIKKRISMKIKIM